MDTKPASTKTAPIAVANAPAKKTRSGPAIMAVCLLVAVCAVLFLPMLLGSATSSPASSTVVAREVESSASYSSLDEAAAELGYMPLVPTALPEGATVRSIVVQNGDTLEIEYNLSGNSVVYRTAKGAEDLSGVYTEYSYTSIETVNDVARSYAGNSETEFAMAVWAAEGNTYALVAEAGAAADDLRMMAESID